MVLSVPQYYFILDFQDLHFYYKWLNNRCECIFHVRLYEIDVYIYHDCIIQLVRNPIKVNGVNETTDSEVEKISTAPDIFSRYLGNELIFVLTSS